MEEKLYAWFVKQRERNCTINGPILKTKAMELFKTVHPDKDEKDFSASEGWFAKFKRRHGMRFLKVCGEILFSDTTTVTPFIHKLRAKMD